jgi:hypothetical protein
MAPYSEYKAPLGKHVTCMNNRSRSGRGRIPNRYARYRKSCVAVEKKKSKCQKASHSSVVGVASLQHSNEYEEHRRGNELGVRPRYSKLVTNHEDLRSCFINVPG